MTNFKTAQDVEHTIYSERLVDERRHVRGDSSTDGMEMISLFTQDRYGPVDKNIAHEQPQHVLGNLHEA